MKKTANRKNPVTKKAKKAITSSAAARLKTGPREWKLRLYIAGMSVAAREALHNLEAICDEHLDGKYKIEVIDLLDRPQLARGDQIIAVPTLVRRLPPPMKKIIGDLSNRERVLV